MKDKRKSASDTAISESAKANNHCIKNIIAERVCKPLGRIYIKSKPDIF